MINKGKYYIDSRIEAADGPREGSRLVTKSVVAETLLVARTTHGSGDWR
jgi:hypothetical protein